MCKHDDEGDEVTTTNRKRPALSDAMRSVLRAERQRAARAAKGAWDRQLNAARNELARAQYRVAHQRDTDAEALITGTGHLARAVASSWSVTTPIEIRTGRNLSAWTDFSKIDITLPQSAVQAVKDHDVERIADMLQFLRGLIYHEVGHIRFTVPPQDAFTELGYGIRPTSVQLGVDPHKFLRAWNLLEDQRMENLVVEESPVIASYFSVMAMQAFFTQPDPKVWLLLMRRPWVPADIRRASRKLCINTFGMDPVRTSEQLIQEYFVAPTLAEQFDAVRKFVLLWEDVPQSSQHRDGSLGQWFENRQDRSQKATERVSNGARKLGKQQDPNADLDDECDGAGQGAGEGEDGDEEGQGNGAGQQGQGDINEDGDGGDGGEGSTPPTPGRGHASHGRGEAIQDEIAPTTEAIIDAVSTKVKELIEQQRTADAMGAARDINFQSGSPRSLPPHPSIGLLAPEELAKAQAVAQEMTQAFDQAMSDRAPSWHRREEHGVLDALAYRTRNNGDTDYWNLWDDGGNSAPDMAVSVVLDVSWSMDGHQHHLGSAAYAIKLACEHLNLPCTVTTFADRAFTLWGAEDPAEPVSVGMCGGTDPIPAMDDLTNQRHEKRQHLVVVLTDGEFGDFPGFSGWAFPGMSILGVAFGDYYGLHESLARHGANQTVMINDLAALPPLVGHFILDHIV